MNFFIWAMELLLLTASLMLVFSLMPRRPLFTYLANFLGPLGIVLGCALGMTALFMGEWESILQWSVPWGLPLGSGRMGIDAMSRIFLLPVFGLGAICTLSGVMSFKHYSHTEHNFAAHWFFFCFLVLAQAIVIASRDAVLFLLAWEVMSLVPFFLINFNDDEPSVREASWTYLIAAHLGAVFLIALFALLWYLSGSSYSFFSGIKAQPVFLSAIFVLSLLGFGAKAGIAPLHIWLPEAHPAAPSHVSAFLSGAMISAGLYGIFRIFDCILPVNPFPVWWGWTLLVLGMSTALMAIFKASSQVNLKRLLAYSSVENMGIMFVALGTGLIGLSLQDTLIAILGFSACLLHMINHAAFKGLLFLGSGEILHSAHTVRLDLLGGLQKRLPMLGTLFALGTAAIVSLPPLNGFMSEFLLALALSHGITTHAQESRLALLLTMAGIMFIGALAMVTFAKAYGMAFLGEPRSGAAANPEKPHSLTMLPLFLLAIACVALAVLAPQCFEHTLPALYSIMTGDTAPVPSVIKNTFTPGIKETPFTVPVPFGYVALQNVLLVGLTALLFIIVLLMLRRILLRKGKVRHSQVWGCGFLKPTARIQYTQDSFVQPLSHSFKTLMGLKVRKYMEPGYFPQRASLDVASPDRLRTRIFVPLFEAVRRVCDSLKVIQSGRIHFYLMYILATLIGLLVWGFAA